MIAKLLIPILAVEECSGVALTIPAGATIDFEFDEVVVGIMDFRWNGETYFANLEDLLEASGPAGRITPRPAAWVN